MLDESCLLKATKRIYTAGDGSDISADIGTDTGKGARQRYPGGISRWTLRGEDPKRDLFGMTCCRKDPNNAFYEIGWNMWN